MSASPAEQRFWAKVDRSGGDEACWPWRAAKTRHGYGMVGHNGKVRTSSRVAWELAHGPLPEAPGYHGACVMHTCDNPSCCNPKHLRLGTHQDNMKDRDQKGRANTSGLGSNRRSKTTSGEGKHRFGPSEAGSATSALPVTQPGSVGDLVAFLTGMHTSGAGS